MSSLHLPHFNGEFATAKRIPHRLGENAADVELWTPYEPHKGLSFLPLRRLKVLAQNARPFPASEVLKAPTSDAKRWCIYFCYLAEGGVQPHHKFTIEKLIEDGITPLVVCAAPTPEQAQGFADLPIGGLIWKALAGYDFSGYSVGLDVLAGLGRPLSLFIMNDSVLGPFSKVADLFESSPWKVTSLISSHSVETHFQSFFLHIDDFTSADLSTLQRVFFQRICFNAQGSVSFLQETRIPSGFKGRFTAGSILSPATGFERHYYMLSNPAGLLDIGAPLIKRSVFEKFGSTYDQPAYNDLLAAKGHPRMG